ncbi:ribosomal L7Ae/L30e/S12e/Gadd45 family protein [Candidatus Woesearchaeota archaeon]|nr:ribosomal L7Ae/L30e/S12e/Gadd45 family protein [Candidatus Woesearchaeota archaeon]
MKELRAALKEGKIILGTELTLKNLKKGKVKLVYASSNCPKDVLNDLKHYCKIFNATLKEMKETNEELGVICKKPFSISVLSF